jgi:hypothetical protein
VKKCRSGWRPARFRRPADFKTRIVTATKTSPPPINEPNTQIPNRRGLDDFHPVGMPGVAMKNTHHAEMNELLIGRNLDWVKDGGVFREEHTPYRVVSEKSRKNDSASKKRK